MPEHRDVPIQQLQHQILDALQSAARGRIRRIARKLLQLVVDPADRPIDPSLDDRMGVTHAAPEERIFHRKRWSCPALR